MAHTRYEFRPKALVTDLDGTLIPLEANEPNGSDLRTLATELSRNDTTIVFCTGRHFASVLQAIRQFQLLDPDWLICDVGTTLRRRVSNDQFELASEYGEHLAEKTDGVTGEALRSTLASIAGLRLQEDEKQGRFKLSYYADANLLNECVSAIQDKLNESNAPFSIISSIDPFNGDGLIDLLPAGVSKAYATAWWCAHVGVAEAEVVFAGDSGNDYAAFVSGCRTIIVRNADRALARRVYDRHRDKGWRNRLFLARETATSGVLEGARWFGVVDNPVATELQLGATPVAHGTTAFRVWAPTRHKVTVDVVDHDGTKRRYPLARSEFGYFSATVAGVGPGTDYQYTLDDQTTRPDPCSRFQPDGVHGVSRVVDPNSFPWTDQDWKGVRKRDLVIYELHLGAFTTTGTFQAAIERLDELVELGITAVELMPVAQSPGRWNWGYDGVGLYAVRNSYGTPDDFKAFVDACHARGLAVVLDVVYNHFGPEGNYLSDFGPYFSRKHRTPWGEAFNFDGKHSSPVRKFIVDNALYWLSEYHLDGLRLDAIHFMIDDSELSIVDEVRVAVTEFARTSTHDIHLIAESNVYDDEMLAPTKHRRAYDASWCDCLMHSVYSYAVPDLNLTRRDYHGLSDIVESLRSGYIFTGQTTGGAGYQRGVTTECGNLAAPVESFVVALQTHDSVGNHPHGKRIHHLTSKSFQKAAAALFLLYPSIPMVFMGEESAADAPFPFFADFHDRRLRAAVDRGRMNEYAHHNWKGAVLPSSDAAFHTANCQSMSRGDNDMRSWYRELIALRKAGITEQWLNKETLQVECDESIGLVTLRYLRPGGGNIEVRSRLTPKSHPGCEPIRVERPTEILANSEPDLRQTKDSLFLKPNHTIVTSTE